MDPRRQVRLIRRDAYQEPRPALDCCPANKPDAEWEQRCSEWARRIEIELTKRNWAGAKHVVDLAERESESCELALGKTSTWKSK